MGDARGDAEARAFILALTGTDAYRAHVPWDALRRIVRQAADQLASASPTRSGTPAKTPFDAPHATCPSDVGYVRRVLHDAVHGGNALVPWRTLADAVDTHLSRTGATIETIVAGVVAEDDVSVATNAIMMDGRGHPGDHETAEALAKGILVAVAAARLRAGR